MVLVLSAGFVWGTIALLLKRERQQSNVNFEESIITSSSTANIPSSIAVILQTKKLKIPQRLDTAS